MKISIACAAAFALLFAAPAFADPITTQVESGALTGQSDHGIAVFRDIPYAAPPVGALRWRPPQAALPWTGVRAAAVNGPACMQPMRPDGRANGGGASGPMSEDCLTLNVFAPARAKGAPVLVWIHGGSNTMGMGAIYDGSAFARDGVVLVAINYRLGAFGFFSHPALTKEAGDAPFGNYGLMDQIAALKWVKRNAAAFGGDPDNITVAGESAGAIDIVALLGMPAASGLFNRAIVESNIGWGQTQTLDVAQTAGAALSFRAGAQVALGPDRQKPAALPRQAGESDTQYDRRTLAHDGSIGATATADSLRSIPAADLIAHQPGGGGVVADGRLVRQSAADMIGSGRQVDVPIIIGSNSYEASLLAGRGPVPQAIADNFIDGLAGAPARWIAGRFNQTGSPAWLYYFSYVLQAERATAPGAAHASEIPYVFDWPALSFNPASPTGAQDHAEATLIHSCWVAFAKTGAPSCASGPKWPAYSTESDQLMEFGVDSGVRVNFRKTQLDAQETTHFAPKPAPAP